MRTKTIVIVMGSVMDITITCPKELDFRKIREILNEVDKSVNPKEGKVWCISVTGIRGVTARKLDNIAEITLVYIKFNQPEGISAPVVGLAEDAISHSLHRDGEPEPYFTVEYPPATMWCWMQQIWSGFWRKIF